MPLKTQSKFDSNKKNLNIKKPNKKKQKKKNNSS